MKKWNNPDYIDSVLPDGVKVSRPLCDNFHREKSWIFIDPTYGPFSSSIRGMLDVGKSTHPTLRAIRANTTTYSDPIKRNSVVQKRQNTINTRFSKEEFRQKQIEGNLKKFNTEWASSTMEFRSKVENTCISKYGVKNVAKVDIFKRKTAATRSNKIYPKKDLIRSDDPGKYENNLIYALVDPRTKEVRYIGKSSSGLTRPKNHTKLSHLQKDKTYKGNWIRQLVRLNLEPEIIILQNSHNKKDLTEIEKQYILLYRKLGAKLTNLTDGGEGTPGLKRKKARDIASLA